jgi:hypothetical protein
MRFFLAISRIAGVTFAVIRERRELRASISLAQIVSAKTEVQAGVAGVTLDVHNAPGLSDDGLAHDVLSLCALIAAVSPSIWSTWSTFAGGGPATSNVAGMKRGVARWSLSR